MFECLVLNMLDIIRRKYYKLLLDLKEGYFKWKQNIKKIAVDQIVKLNLVVCFFFQNYFTISFYQIYLTLIFRIPIFSEL